MNIRTIIRLGVILVVSLIVIGGGFLLIRSSFLNTASNNDLGPSHLAGPFKVHVAIDPEQPKVGKNTIVIFVRDTNDKPVTDAQIGSTAEMAAMGSMPAMRATAEITQDNPGHYSGEFEIQMDGAWPLTVVIESQTVGSAELVFDMTTSREGLRLATATQSSCLTCTVGSAPVAEGEEPVISAISYDDTLGAVHLAGPFKVQVAVDPEQPKAGRNDVTIFVRDTNGRPVTDAEIRSTAEMAAMGSMPAMRATAEITQDNPGYYSGEFEIQMDGAWPLTIVIESRTIGSAELVFDMTTSRKGLRLSTATQSSCPTCAMSPAPMEKMEETPGTIHVDARRRQLIGLTTEKAVRRSLTQTIRAAGEVVFDETRLSDISLKFDGWIGELNANYLGVQVTKGQPLFSVYSPELVSAQEEYLETRRRQKEGSSLLTAARRRLTLWDISSVQIRALENRGHALEYLPILAPSDGTVIEKNIVEGTAVKAGMTLLRVADLSRVWVEGQIYEYELSHVVVGMEAEVVLPGVEGRRYPGKVAYVYPYLEDDTRTARIRVELDNSDGRLRPDMYAHVHLSIDLGERLIVPESAVLYAGDTRLVFLDKGDGYLEPRKVRTGLRNDNYIEVLDGLGAGDRVVTSGNFLIASESKLKAGIDQW